MATTPRDGQDYLLLKFHKLKQWRVSTERAQQALQEYFDRGINPSLVLTHLTDRQKELLCNVIDECNGYIENDWTGKSMTKDEAKAYVMEGGS